MAVNRPLGLGLAMPYARARMSEERGKRKLLGILTRGREGPFMIRRANTVRHFAPAVLCASRPFAPDVAKVSSSLNPTGTPLPNSIPVSA